MLNSRLAPSRDSFKNPQKPITKEKKPPKKLYENKVKTLHGKQTFNLQKSVFFFFLMQTSFEQESLGIPSPWRREDLVCTKGRAGTSWNASRRKAQCFHKASGKKNIAGNIFLAENVHLWKQSTDSQGESWARWASSPTPRDTCKSSSVGAAGWGHK